MIVIYECTEAETVKLISLHQKCKNIQWSIQTIYLFPNQKNFLKRELINELK
jgi:hypothetical protein